DMRTRGRAFELNGIRTVLQGVCRHDMWKDQGFTLTYDQMRQDMQMIKMMGANFARLVHYPHHRRIVELADELGLLVTEEPGHWNVDFHKMSRGRIDVSLQVLERAIRRDWNSPSVFAWLAGNECTVTVDYLRETKALCNRLDPVARPVSFAHIYNDSKNTFDAGGLDFYTRHMYNFDDKKFDQAPEDFGPSKPLVHTEWGWEDPHAGQTVYERSFDRLMNVVESGKVSGYSFWSWQDGGVLVNCCDGRESMETDRRQTTVLAAAGNGNRRRNLSFPSDRWFCAPAGFDPGVAGNRDSHRPQMHAPSRSRPCDSAHWFPV